MTFVDNVFGLIGATFVFLVLVALKLAPLLLLVYVAVKVT